MLSIFSCVVFFFFFFCLKSMSSLEKYLLKSFTHLCFFFWYWAMWDTCISWRLIYCSICEYVVLFCGLSFHFVYGLICWETLLSLIRCYLFIFIFITLGCFSVAQSCLTLCDLMDCSTPGFPVLHYYSGRWIQKDIALIYIKECSAYIFL